MEFDFFNEWDLVKTVKVGSKLMKKLTMLQSIGDMDVISSTFPEGHPDSGEEIERYLLKSAKYSFAKDLSEILSDECQQRLNNEKPPKPTPDVLSDPQVLAELLALVLDDNTTHFTLG